MEPLYHGEPILAVAAVDELTATEAIERIQIEYEPLPFVVDPIRQPAAGGPNARTQGNVWVARPRAVPPLLRVSLFRGLRPRGRAARPQVKS
jgi:CO/xanthine dehydrogenase Mo-binding subunit